MKLIWGSLEAMLAALVAADAPLDPDGLWLSVITAYTDNGLDTVLSDLTEPTLADIPRQPIATWSAVRRLRAGMVAVDGPALEFKPGGGTADITIVGWLLADALTAGNLVSWAILPAPVILPSSAYSWGIVPRITLDPRGQWSAEVTYNG